jgi:hypothetical protein
MVEAALVRALVLASCSALTLACSEGADPASGRALEGTLEVIVVEGPHGGTRYFLMPNDAAVDPVELRFEHAPSSGSGARIAVDGRYEGGSLSSTPPAPGSASKRSPRRRPNAPGRSPS